MNYMDSTMLTTGNVPQYFSVPKALCILVHAELSSVHELNIAEAEEST